MIDRDYDMPISPCTACGKPMDAATNMSDDEAPRPGDITICIECGHIMAFADDLVLRNLTDAEMYEIAGNKELIMAQRVLAKAKEKRHDRTGTDKKTR